MIVEEKKLLVSSIGLSRDRLMEIVDYDPETGVCRWKEQVSKIYKVGDIAGSEDTKGYIRVCVGGVRYGIHTLGWLFVHNEWVMIDHKDEKPWHNWITNLRKATYSQNNHRKHNYNPLGFVGVRQSPNGRYRASIRINGIITSLGTYDTPEEASNAYKKAATEHFGEFANG